MSLAEAGCVFMAFILYISGVQGRANSICALKGSSVDLPCSAEHPTSNNKWYTVHTNESVLKELSADENHGKYTTSKENQTLTIKDLRESDAKFYCCRNNTDQPGLCRSNRIQLRVADLQVKVIPTTEGQTVTLMCSTSCPLTEQPAAYSWYKNREFLYQDWSPWYQQLVSSDEAVTYSCAVEGYEDLRAPEVSVDSVTSDCFNVTYAKGRMCSYKQTSVDEPCSITYPTEVHVQKTPAENVTCRTSCPQIDYPTEYVWYRGGYSVPETKNPFTLPIPTDEKFACAVKDHEDLLSAEVCFHDKSCWSVNYIRRRICALEGSSVNISSLTVKFTPSAEVTEGQRVTLTCSTSCPLPDNTTYIWYLNSRPLTLPENQHKHLVLDPVSSQHTGNYSCAIKTHIIISSNEKTLTVHSITGRWIPAAAGGVGAVLLVIILLTVFWGIRKKTSSSASPRTENSDEMGQVNSVPIYANIPARSTAHEDHRYGRLHFSKD